jgi:hypothetical protein
VWGTRSGPSSLAPGSEHTADHNGSGPLLSAGGSSVESNANFFTLTRTGIEGRIAAVFGVQGRFQLIRCRSRLRLPRRSTSQ